MHFTPYANPHSKWGNKHHWLQITKRETFCTWNTFFWTKESQFLQQNPWTWVRKCKNNKRLRDGVFTLWEWGRVGGRLSSQSRIHGIHEAWLELSDFCGLFYSRGNTFVARRLRVLSINSVKWNKTAIRQSAQSTNLPGQAPFQDGFADFLCNCTGEFYWYPLSTNTNKLLALD